MKHLLVVALSALILSGCATPTDSQLHFSPAADSNQITLNQPKSVKFNTTDARTAQYLALIIKNDDKALPVHAKQNVRIAFSDAMKRVLESQGFVMSLESKNQIELEIHQALVRVSTSTFSNEMNGKVILKVAAETPTGKFVKTYTGSAKATNSMGASNEQIEQLIEHVSKLVLNEIANDIELIDYIEENFQ
jgi:uncharacterized lipoprotein